ncbi:MAG TPA: NAD-dependent epimerase/dehydratase family protein [Methanoregulaceae archaeon]|nr:NAD-dependent epimerase/dehydratase family protein [Methanoregulaceae archaeon]HPD74681.1 NAD-dependent epimerase/dehydratase family protein [Methanoregulaceae archaeon]
MFDVVTGGAGFIGSHLVDTLVARGDRVTVIDSLAAGKKVNIARHIRTGSVSFVRCDLLKKGWQEALDGADRVWHLAADPDVRQSAVSPLGQVNNNILTTFRVLEAMRCWNVPEIAFTSTSTVYGDATVIPTPEDYTPLEPVSVYGGTKLACESMISAYCHSFGMRAFTFRFANIIGERSGHGVITDFIGKLRKDPRNLEILGDGRQTKSYLLVKDCIDAMLFVAERAREPVNTFNIGSEDRIDVKTIARIVEKEMGLSPVSHNFTGGERGWVGDVPRMQLSIEKIKALGWCPEHGSQESVRLATRALCRE